MKWLIQSSSLYCSWSLYILTVYFWKIEVEKKEKGYWWTFLWILFTPIQSVLLWSLQECSVNGRSDISVHIFLLNIYVSSHHSCSSILLFYKLSQLQAISYKQFLSALLSVFVSMLNTLLNNLEIVRQWRWHAILLPILLLTNE